MLPTFGCGNCSSGEFFDKCSKCHTPKKLCRRFLRTHECVHTTQYSSPTPSSTNYLPVLLITNPLPPSPTSKLNCQKRIFPLPWLPAFYPSIQHYSYHPTYLTNLPSNLLPKKINLQLKIYLNWPQHQLLSKASNFSQPTKDIKQPTSLLSQLARRMLHASKPLQSSLTPNPSLSTTLSTYLLRQNPQPSTRLPYPTSSSAFPLK